VIAVLEVFQKESNYSEIQSAFKLILLLAIPLGLVIALLAGWWITRAALRPIDRMSRTVARIAESRDLSRRVHSVGPNDELGRLAHTFDHMMDRLEQAFEQQKRFVADASHELRTPLTAIRGNADLMRYAPPDEREICIASIRREAERMSRLVADLLLLAEADADQHALHIQPVDLCDLMIDVHRSAELISAGKVEVLLEPAEDVTVMGDADRLKQLVLNLVDNAVKFTPRGGRVTLSLYAEPTGARIEVADTGVGIPREERDAIFSRFYRVEESRSTRGSGLGLAICAWVVAAHGGEINLDSEPGRGTRFIVRLPAQGANSQSAPATVAAAH
jgi:signal transduction histidine kinase